MFRYITNKVDKVSAALLLFSLCFSWVMKENRIWVNVGTQGLSIQGLLTLLPHLTHTPTHTTGFLECPKWWFLTNTYYVHNGRCRLYFSLLGQRAKSLDRGQKHHWAVLFHLLYLRDNVLHKELLCLAATATPHHAFMLIVFHRCLLLNQPPFY